jgi:hypothetical protein
MPKWDLKNIIELLNKLRRLHFWSFYTEMRMRKERALKSGMGWGKPLQDIDPWNICKNTMMVMWYE